MGRPEQPPLWQSTTRDGLDMLTRSFSFADWAGALAFVNAVGAVADRLDHHPEVLLSWGRVVVTVWSHDARGLTARDVRFCHAVDTLVAPPP